MLLHQGHLGIRQFGCFRMVTVVDLTEMLQHGRNKVCKQHFIKLQDTQRRQLFLLEKKVREYIDRVCKHLNKK